MVLTYQKLKVLLAAFSHQMLVLHENGCIVHTNNSYILTYISDY